MASDSGLRMQVTPHAGGVILRLGSLSLELGHAEAGQLHEEIGRALMPGQPEAEAAGRPTAAEIARCDDSEDAFHRCRACYDYAAERDRTLAELKDEQAFAASANRAARDARQAWNDPDDHPF